MSRSPKLKPESEPTGLRERHKQNRRLAILRAARELLREDATHGLTKDSIAERAEVSPATVYNLMGTRAQLFAALADDFMDEVARRAAERTARDPVERARALVELTCDVILDDPLVYAALVRDWPESGLVLREGPSVWLVDAFAAARDQGALLPEIDVRLLASSVRTACVGAVHQWASGLIDARGFRARCMFSLDLAFAAAATAGHRKALVSALAVGRRAIKKEK